MLLDSIRGYLANEPHNLQISSRFRFAKAGTAASIPASGAGNASVFVALPAITPNQAFWIELVAGSLTPAAKGLTISDLGLFFANSSQAIFLPFGEATLTNLSPQALTGLIFFGYPPLVAFEDLNGMTTTPPIAQPFNLGIQVTANNSSAGAINLTVALNVMLRIVSGLQEG